MILKVEKAESRALSVSQKVFSKKKYRTWRQQQTAESICGKVQLTKSQKLHERIWATTGVL